MNSVVWPPVYQHPLYLISSCVKHIRKQLNTFICLALSILVSVLFAFVSDTILAFIEI